MSVDPNEIFLRPRFSMDFDKKADDLIQKFKDNLKNPDCKYCSKIIDAHIFLDVPKKESHFWSPQLHLEIEETGGNKSTVKGLFGPKPQVWTLFMFIHFIVGIAFISFAIMAYTRVSLDKSATFPITMIIVLPIIWIVLYFLGQMGKKTGHKQMDELHGFMMDTLER